METREIVPANETPKMNGSIWIIGSIAVTEAQLKQTMGYSYDRGQNQWTRPSTK